MNNSRRPTRRFRRSYTARFFAVEAAALATVLAPVTPVALAQQAGERPARVILIGERAGLSAFFTNPKDKAFGDALAMLPARLAELPLEVPDMAAAPMPLIQSVLRAVSRPARIAVVDRGADPETGAPGVGGVVSFAFDDPAQAAALEREVMGFLAQTPLADGVQPSPDRPGLSRVVTPIGPVDFGPVAGAGGTRYEVLVGAIGDAEAVFREHLPAKGAGESLIRARLDLAALSPVVGFLLGMAEAQHPEVGAIVPFLRGRGLIGDDALTIDASLSRAEGKLIGAYRLGNAARFAEGLALSRVPVTDAMLSAIPSDAVLAGMTSSNLRRTLTTSFGEVMKQAAEEGDEFAAEAVEFIEEWLGWTGDGLGFYTSDATGGGGIWSAVGLVAVSDRAALLARLDDLGAMLEAALAETDWPADYVRLDRAGAGGVDRFALRFPGVPIPFEPVAAVTDKWLIIALTPQGLEAAVKQATGAGGKGLPSNPKFAGARFRTASAPVQVGYMDTERLLRTGYMPLCLLGSAVANAVRSPHGAEREPGAVIPSWPALSAGVAPLVSLGFWDGEAFVSEARADGSLLVTVGGVAGMYAGILPLALPMMLGTALPAVGKARSNAQELIDSANLRTLITAAISYASDREDQRFPADVAALVAGGFLMPETLESPVSRGGDGGPDYFLRTGVEVSFRGDEVVAYSRSSYMYMPRVAVGFADVHVDILTHEQFHRLLEQPQNAGVDWMLPARAAPDAEDDDGDKPPFIVWPKIRPARMAG